MPSPRGRQPFISICRLTALPTQNSRHTKLPGRNRIRPRQCAAGAGAGHGHVQGGRVPVLAGESPPATAAASFRLAVAPTVVAAASSGWPWLRRHPLENLRPCDRSMQSRHVQLGTSGLQAMCTWIVSQVVCCSLPARILYCQLHDL